MKPEYTKQEILLFTNTSFARREFSSNATENNKILSANDRLEKACWDGLLGDLLPEVVDSTGKKNYISDIVTDNNFLLINLGSPENEFPCFSSLNPNFFVPAVYLN